MLKQGGTALVHFRVLFFLMGSFIWLRLRKVFMCASKIALRESQLCRECAKENGRTSCFIRGLQKPVVRQPLQSSRPVSFTCRICTVNSKLIRICVLPPWRVVISLVGHPPSRSGIKSAWSSFLFFFPGATPISGWLGLLASRVVSVVSCRHGNKAFGHSFTPRPGALGNAY